jgi:hypothetical protein
MTSALASSHVVSIHLTSDILALNTSLSFCFFIVVQPHPSVNPILLTLQNGKSFIAHILSALAEIGV